MVVRLVALFYCHLIVKPNNLSRFKLILNIFTSALIERMVIARTSRGFFFRFVLNGRLLWFSFLLFRRASARLRIDVPVLVNHSIFSSSNIKSASAIIGPVCSTVVYTQIVGLKHILKNAISFGRLLMYAANRVALGQMTACI